MSIGSEVLVLTCTMADVGNTRMCVQDVSCGVLSWDVCMLRVVLRPNTEPVETESNKGDTKSLIVLKISSTRSDSFSCKFKTHFTWHDHKGPLWLHGN